MQKIEEHIRRFKQSKDTMTQIVTIKYIEDELKKLRKELVNKLQKENK